MRRNSESSSIASTVRLVAQRHDERVDERPEGDVQDVNVVTGDQLQEQFDGSAEGRRRHDEGHRDNTTSGEPRKVSHSTIER